MHNKLIYYLILFLLPLALTAQSPQNVKVSYDEEDTYLLVDNEKFMINGMNWDYIPIGTNAVNADFWNKSDAIIKAGLDSEMSLLRNMNVNVVRQYSGVPAKWIQYIYENYGIYTILNHSFGRYGVTINSVWNPITEYDDKKVSAYLMSEVTTLAKEYKNTPGLLMYLLGNENNYGLFWQGSETEDFPDEEAQREFVGQERGRPMYKLMNRAAKKMKEIDGNHPVAICNGDVLFIDIIAEECKDVDIYGTNVYRGSSFRDMFDVVKEKLNKPILMTEFGSDAFNALTLEEDQQAQAYYLMENWKEIYQNAGGVGKARNAIGGCTFQFTDGWWKFGFNDRAFAEIHDPNASWENGGYHLDHVSGENNMNEEWFGICAKGPTNSNGLYQAYPRAAYYALKEAHALDPYSAETTPSSIASHFAGINTMDAVLRARGDKAELASKQKVRMSAFRAELSTYNTGGELVTTPDVANPAVESYPDQLGFDHMQSVYIGVEANPTSNMRANANFNILNNVAQNPIDEIFYENRGRNIDDETVDGRLNLYSAEIDWKEKAFEFRGFYRTGHFHWGYEGDFFGLYPQAYYGPNLDLYNGEILGIEIDAKRKLEGLKLAFGPQLWWGANPAVLLKYERKLGQLTVAGIFHEDIANANEALTSIAIPVPKTRRATLYLQREFGKLDLELGGIWGGSPLNGRSYQFITEENGEYTVYDDFIETADNWGAKAKLKLSLGLFNWYAQGSVRGLVANGSADPTQTFTGWRLKDNGSGNQNNILSGFTVTMGNFQIGPNFLWQKPLVGPVPADVQGPGRLRNIQDDPFAVRGNRETVAGELVVTFDPTPGTWMYEWDNDRVEDARFAISAGFLYRHLPTTQDAAIGFLGNRNTFAFPASAPAQDLWESNIRIVSKLSNNFGLIANVLIGTAQANGDDERTIDRYALDLRTIYKKMKVTSQVKLNDWGPFDYHRDFNLTYPVQLMLDVSTTLGKPDWFMLPSTQLGVQGKWRSLDEYSPRYLPNDLDYVPDPSGGDPGNGNEWEVRTYFNISIGK